MTTWTDKPTTRRNRPLTTQLDTLEPVETGLHLLLTPEAQRIDKLMRTNPVFNALVDMFDGNVEAALNYFLANELNISSDAQRRIIALLLQNVDTPCPSSAFRRNEAGECVFDGTNPLGQTIQWTFNPDTGRVRYTGPAAPTFAGADNYRLEMSLSQWEQYVNNVGSAAELFIRPAQIFNNPGITNMSDRALAALTFSQVYREEDWFKAYNWIYPYYNSPNDPNGGALSDPDSLNSKRYWPIVLRGLDSLLSVFEQNVPRLDGFGFGLGNQPFEQAENAAYWWIDYSLNPSIQARYGEYRVGEQPSTIPFFQEVLRFRDYFVNNLDAAYNDAIALQTVLPQTNLIGLLQAALIDDGSSTDATQSTVLNTLRFVWSGARLREGAGPWADDILALNYSLVNDAPIGRQQHQVSAFSLITAVYSDSIEPTAENGFARTASLERDKAIAVVEGLNAGDYSSEGFYRILQPLGIGEPLQTPYQDFDGDTALDSGRYAAGEYQAGVDYDFLPYTQEEADTLVNTLQDEGNPLLCTSSYLRSAYIFYHSEGEWENVIAGSNCS